MEFKGKSILLDGEEVLSKVVMGGAFKATTFYATNKRLVRISKREASSGILVIAADEIAKRAKKKPGLETLEYDRISISFKKFGLGSSIFRVFAVGFGIFCIALGIFGYIGPTITTGTTIIRTKAPIGISLLLWVIGFLVILASLNGRYGYYQIVSSDLEQGDLKRWRIQRTRWGAGKIEDFMKIVAERSGQKVK